MVLNLMKYIPNPRNHEFFFDNYFTSYPLMVYLKGKGIRATGTIRENRTQKCPTMDSKTMKKMNKGSSDYRFDQQNQVLCVKWKDNNVCSMLTNYDTVAPFHYVKRWSKATKSKEYILQPKLFSTYNSGIGGVDLHDQCISLYRVSVKEKKWW
ncbi:piggyBac transposable element-derived protein 2-like [Onthophagus taurus]|uniref:piggyBac transposable element-derived protein 2-like n=1 Tax=Onthophagus taurus TaxID=166361 RepID=UPI0039BE86D2